MARQQSCPYASKDCTLTFWALVGYRLLLRDGLMTRLTPLLAVEQRNGTSRRSIDGSGEQSGASTSNAQYQASVPSGSEHSPG
jgi:hypothetical protein